MGIKNYILMVLNVILTAIYILTFPLVIIFLSGDLFWVEGWIFGIWFTLMSYSIYIYMYMNDPSLLEERSKKPGTTNQKGWDKYLISCLMIGFIAWCVIMPLDAKRFGWTAAFPFWLKALGTVALLIASFFFYRSYMDNTYLSPVIRIQTERKQHVVSTGVYGFVRHPLYLGGVLLFEGAPLLLGSKYGIIIGYILVFLLILRIIGEERMLMKELNGYAYYKKKVKYRLIPFIW